MQLVRLTLYRENFRVNGHAGDYTIQREADAELSITYTGLTYRARGNYAANAGEFGPIQMS